MRTSIKLFAVVVLCAGLLDTSIAGPFGPSAVMENTIEIIQPKGLTNAVMQIGERQLMARSIDQGRKANLTADLDYIESFQKQLAKQVGDKYQVNSNLGMLRTDKTYLANARWLINATAIGEVDGRIFGGHPTSPADFADCVTVGDDSEWCCTGTLVASNLVVTAGHCAVGDCASRVFFGTDVDATNGFRVIQRVMPPPLLDGFGGKAKNYINDIAVLVLERDVKGVKPRAIAKEIQTDSARYVRLVGFGATNSAGTEGYGIKREVDVPMASTACGAQGDQVQYGCNGGIEFVAGKPFLNLDSCNGDSGGPAYIWYESDWLLAGVTSRPTKNSKQACGDGGVYTRVDKFETWFHPQHYNDLI